MEKLKQFKCQVMRGDDYENKNENKAYENKLIK